MIGLQELNLAYRYPLVFWNAACLIVDSGGAESTDLESAEVDEIEELYLDGPIEFGEPEEEDEDTDDDGFVVKAAPKKTTKSPSYDKIATAIGKMMSRGIEVLPPDINTSTYTFTPDVENNTILYGLSGITRIGDDLIKSIIENRPYQSVEDFASRIKLQKPNVITLIKAGAFDRFGDRIELMEEYIRSISEPKKTINLRNFSFLIREKLVPEELDFERKVFNFTAYLRKRKDGNNYDLDQVAYEFYRANFDEDKLKPAGEAYPDSVFQISKATWDAIYTAKMGPVRNWMKKEQLSILDTVNKKLFTNLWDKYCLGSLSKWEMDSVSYYSHEHELAGANLESYGFKSFNELDERPEVDKVITIRNRPVTLLKIQRIAGTVLGRDKMKKIVTILTMDGVAQVRFFGDLFGHYDRQISEVDPNTGKKKVVQRSIFTRGNKIVVSGIRDGDTFIAKKYARTPWHTVELIEEVLPNGEMVITNRESA